MVAEPGGGQHRKRGEGWNGEGNDDLRARRLQGCDLRPDVRVGRDIVLPARARDRRRAELIIEASHAVETKFVVLEEIPDLLATEVLFDVLGEDLALDGVVRLPTERHGVIG